VILIKQLENLGSAHIYVELKGRWITVRHGDDKHLLLQIPARKGTWESIWRALKGRK